MLLLSWQNDKDDSLKDFQLVWIMRYMKVLVSDSQFLFDNEYSDAVKYTGTATRLHVLIQVFFPAVPLKSIKVGILHYGASTYVISNLAPVPYFSDGNGPYVVFGDFEVPTDPIKEEWLVVLEYSDGSKVPKNADITAYASFAAY